MTDPGLSFADFDLLMQQQNARYERDFVRLLAGRPLPSVSDLLQALQRVPFTQHPRLLSMHPGSKIFERVEIASRAHQMLLAFYDDLTAAFGRFQGIATAHGGLGRNSWQEISFSFTKTLFAFSAAAKARDEMIGRLADRGSPRGRELVEIARAEYSDVALAAFVHELRNHLSHSVVEEPSTSIHWSSAESRSARASVSVRADRFNPSRWPKQARLFLDRQESIDLMEVAADYVAMALKSQSKMSEQLWSGLRDEERNFIALEAELRERTELSSYGIWVQMLDGRPDLDVMRLLHDRLPADYLGLVRGLEDYSDEQFEAIAVIVDPFGLIEPGLRSRLKARFMRRPSR